MFSEKEVNEKRIKYDAKVKLMVTRWTIISHVLDNLGISKRNTKVRISIMLTATCHGFLNQVKIRAKRKKPANRSKSHVDR